ncbi:hypothetical protein HDU92_003971 [Lobulomyces angularis]|nr:hypothetical protein HDU92_003971 [Lobulomyces angularis]
MAELTNENELKKDSATQPLSARLSTLLLKIKFLWFFGHFATVTYGTIYLLRYGIFSGGATYYSRALYGALLSYSIILYKAHGIPQLSRAFLQRIMMDENSQYLLLAILWVSSTPAAVSLIPYVIFSLFHVVTFTRTEIIPTIQPPPFNTTIKKVVSVLTKFTISFQMKGLTAVAYLEVWVIMPYLVLTIFLGKTSILTPLIYGHFLRFRHFFSPLTRKSFADLENKLDVFFQKNNVPIFLKNIYLKTKEFCSNLNVEHIYQHHAQKNDALTKNEEST